MNSVDAETRVLFRAVQRYSRACRRYIHGRPSPELSLRRLEAAFEHLMAALNDPKVVERLQVVIAAGLAAEEDTLSPLSDRLDHADIQLEIQLARAFGLNPKAVARALQTDAADGVAASTLGSPEEIRERARNFHENLIDQTEIKRQIKERIPKKKRTRRLDAAAVAFTFGTGCAVANGYAIAGMPEAQVSFGVALTAFYSAARDILGEPPKDKD